MTWDPLLTAGLIFVFLMIVFYAAVVIYAAVVFLYDRRQKHQRRKRMKVKT